MTNRLYYGDNLPIMRDLLEEKGAFIDLCYIDPPFNSKRNYNVFYKDKKLKDDKAQEAIFKDTWSNVAYQHNIEEVKKEGLKEVGEYLEFIKRNCPPSYVSYLSMMAIRLYYVWRLLKDTGSLYLHCDPHMGHYLKQLLDFIFRRENFRNEIVWCYYGPGSPGMRQFNRKTDSILWYSKSDTWTFNKDDIREPYKDINQSLRRAMATDGSFSKEEIEEYRQRGKVPENWWVMRIAARSKKEYLGYPTQKPLALLDRIIKASSNKGDVVADFFCGCGTTLDAAQGLNRRWIGADISLLGISLVGNRLKSKYGEQVSYALRGIPYTLEQARELAKSKPFEFQAWVVHHLMLGRLSRKKTGDGGIDGELYCQHVKNDKIYDFYCLLEVKGGGITITQVRAFLKVVKEKQDHVGILIGFEKEITEGMRRACHEVGYLAGTQIPICELVSMESLLKEPAYKPEAAKFNQTYYRASRR